MTVPGLWVALVRMMRQTYVYTEVCQNCGVVYTMFVTEYAKILVKFSSTAQLNSNMLRIWHKYATIVVRFAWITYCLHFELISFP